MYGSLDLAVAGASWRRSMLKTTTALVLVGIMSTAAARVSAHHSFAAEFDENKPIVLTGTVTKIERTNPHGWIYLDVKEPTGTINNWAVETNSPAALARRGMTKESLPIGTEVKVQGYRAKDGSRMINGKTVTFPDGRDLFVGSTTTPTETPYK
jgi:hypothetical protein